MQVLFNLFIAACESKARAEVRVRIEQMIRYLSWCLIMVAPSSNMALEKLQLRTQGRIGDKTGADD